MLRTRNWEERRAGIWTQMYPPSMLFSKGGRGTVPCPSRHDNGDNEEEMIVRRAAHISNWVLHARPKHFPNLV